MPFEPQFDNYEVLLCRYPAISRTTPSTHNCRSHVIDLEETNHLRAYSQYRGILALDRCDSRLSPQVSCLRGGVRLSTWLASSCVRSFSRILSLLSLSLQSYEHNRSQRCTHATPSHCLVACWPTPKAKARAIHRHQFKPSRRPRVACYLCSLLRAQNSLAF